MTTACSVPRMTGALLLVVALAPGWACAADAGARYQVLTINSLETCSDLNNAVAVANGEDDWRLLYAFSVYTMGYLTGINRLAFDTYDIAGGNNVKTHMVLLRQYCAEHPNDSFDLALNRLVAKLYPQRTTAGPPAGSQAK